MKYFVQSSLWTLIPVAALALAGPSRGEVIVFSQNFDGLPQGETDGIVPNAIVNGNFDNPGIVEFDNNDHNGPDNGNLVAFFSTFGTDFPTTTEVIFDTGVTTQVGFEYSLTFDLASRPRRRAGLTWAISISSCSKARRSLPRASIAMAETVRLRSPAPAWGATWKSDS